jgi:hypothetical protein
MGLAPGQHSCHLKLLYNRSARDSLPSPCSLLRFTPLFLWQMVRKFCLVSGATVWASVLPILDGCFFEQRGQGSVPALNIVCVAEE